MYSKNDRIYVAVCEIFGVKKWCNLENRVQGQLKWRQYSAVICSGALLFSSRVGLLLAQVRSMCSAVTKAHLWHSFSTSPMASSALQHWTASPTKEGCHWQAGKENRQTRQLANPARYP